MCKGFDNKQDFPTGPILNPSELWGGGRRLTGEPRAVSRDRYLKIPVVREGVTDHAEKGRFELAVMGGGRGENDLNMNGERASPATSRVQTL
jgi:hypothetical protein